MVPVSLYRVRSFKDWSLSNDRLGITVIGNCRYDNENGLIFDKSAVNKGKSADNEPDDDSNDNFF